MAKGFNLNVALSATTKQYEEQLAKAQGKTKQFSGGVKKMGSTLGSSMKGVSGIMTPITGQFTGLIGMVGSTGTAMKGLIPVLGSVRAAVISTGIGALLIAVVAAVAALGSALKGTQDGARLMKKALGGISAVITTLLTRLQRLGTAIIKLLRGDFKGAAEDAKAAVTDIGKEVKENFEKGQEYGTAEFDLERKKIDFIVRRAKLETQIAELRANANDADNFNAEERYKAIMQAGKLQRQLSGEIQAIQQEEYELLVKKNALGNNTLDDDRKEQELLKEIYTTRTQEEKTMKSILMKQSSLNKEAGKYKDELQKAAEARIQESITLGPIDLSGQDLVIRPDIVPEVKNPDTLMSELPPIPPLTLRVKPEMDLAALDGIVKNFLKKNEELIYNVADTTMQATMTMAAIYEAQKARELKAAGDNATKKEAIEKKYAKKQQRIAIAQSIINSSLAFTKALSQFPPPLSFIMAGLTAAAGIAEVSTIKSQTFAQGGYVKGVRGGDRVPILAQGGEAVLTEQHQGDLFKMIKRGGKNDTIRITGTLIGDGSQLLGVIDTTKKKNEAY